MGESGTGESAEEATVVLDEDATLEEGGRLRRCDIKMDRFCVVVRDWGPKMLLRVEGRTDVLAVEIKARRAQRSPALDELDA